MGLQKGVSVWLADLGMSNYVQPFLDEGFDDLEVVAEMDMPVSAMFQSCLRVSLSPAPFHI